MADAPLTEPPTDAEWADHVRWAVPPAGTRRDLWVEREAMAQHRARTGTFRPWPEMQDYTAANAVIPQLVQP